MEAIWNENELIYQENDEMIANLGFRHFSPSSLYVIERVWVKDDQSLKIKLIQDFIQHFKADDLQIIPLVGIGIAKNNSYDPSGYSQYGVVYPHFGFDVVAGMRVWF